MESAKRPALLKQCNILTLQARKSEEGCVPSVREPVSRYHLIFQTGARHLTGYFHWLHQPACRENKELALEAGYCSFVWDPWPARYELLARDESCDPSDGLI